MASCCCRLSPTPLTDRSPARPSTDRLPPHFLQASPSSPSSSSSSSSGSWVLFEEDDERFFLELGRTKDWRWVRRLGMGLVQCG